MCEELSKDFTGLEVKAAIDEIGAEKAPEPDGMSTIFYQGF